jgi:chromosome partitioning protein
MYESGTRLAAEVLADLKAFFSSARNTATPWSRARIYETVIRRNVKLAECPSHGKTIFDYEPGSRGSEDYRRLAEEFLSSMGPSPPASGDLGAEQPAAEPPPSPAAVAGAGTPPQQPS